MAVRRESVVLDLDDRLTPGLVRAAAATGLLNRELKNLGGGTNGASRGVRDVERDTTKLNTTLGNSTRELDRFTGRFRLIADAAVTLGPALIPIGAVGVQAVAGLSVEFGAVALSAGTAVLAFHNVGSALTAVNKAALDPTVTNLNAAQLALDGLPPAAAAFTRELASMQPQLKAAQQAAASGLFPGLSQGLDDLQHSIPQVNRVLFEMGRTLGQLGADAAKSLTGPEWADFRNFIEREAPRALETFGRSLGDVLHGIGELIVATAPIGTNFSDGLLRASAAFDQWASSVGKTQGFQDFVAYIEKSGPEVADALASIGSALLAIVEAAAPLSGPVLAALTGVANAIAAIGKSDLGTPIYATIAALALLSRATSSWASLSRSSVGQFVTNQRKAVSAVNQVITAQDRATMSSAALAARQKEMGAGWRTLASGGARVGLATAGLALAASGVADNFGLANTATLAMTGSLAGPWGAAAGAAVGLILDLGKGQQAATVDTKSLTDTLNQQTGAITQNTQAYVAQQLQQQGILDLAQKLHVSLADVTQAALGNGDAYDRVNGQLTAYESTLSGTDLAKVATSSSALFDSISNTSGAIHDAQGNVVQLGNALPGVTQSFDTAKSAAEAFRLEVDRVNDTLTGRASLRDYQASLDDLTASIKKNGKSLDITTEKGRANQAALDAIASSSIKVAQGMKGTNQAHFLTQARKDFIDAAEKLGKSRDEAKALADRLGLLNQVHSAPTIAMKGIPESLSQLRAVYSELNNLRDKTITVTTKRVAGGSVKAGADGMTVPGQRYPYGDKVLTHLAPGEEVITNRHGEADRFRADRAAGRIPAYANGGTVGGSRIKGDEHQSKELQHSIDKLTKAVDADKKSRDDIRQKEQALASSVTTSLRSDLFAQTSPWSGGGGPNGTLRMDIANARAYNAGLHRLAKKGLDGNAFSEIAASGNLQAVQAEAGLSRRQIAQYEHLYNVRQRLTAATGRYAGTARYGQQLADANMTLHHAQASLRSLEHHAAVLNKEIAHLRKEAAHHAKTTGKETGKAINKSASDATRRVRH